MANVTYTVPNKSGSYDGDMVVKQYTSMTIDSGDTVTVDAPCRGLFILVQGDCTINGTLSMLGKGAGINPTLGGGSDNNPVSGNGLRFGFLKAGSTESLTQANTLLNGCGNTARSVIANFENLSSNGIIKTIARQGQDGGGGRSGVGEGNNGNNGSNSGNTLSSGGGGGGGSYNANSGAGSYGSCFIGGSGGGGADNTATASNADTFGRAGGNSNGHGGDTSTGGAGNPNGTNSAPSIRANDTTPNGGGGLIVLVVGGNLTIGSGGKITAEGQGVDVSQRGCPGAGGSTGGGCILLAHRGTYSNSGTVTSDGGNYVKATFGYGGQGGDGGNGSVHTVQIN